MMKVKSASFFMLLLLQCFTVLTFAAQDESFDFFYFVQQWPASLCDTNRSCCYPTTGKPAEDFSIHGLWPNRKNGTWPSNCEVKDRSFNEYEVSDLIPRLQQDWPSFSCPSSDGVGFWTHEWKKHGTCSLLNQHQYFQTALDFKEKANPLKVLKDAGICSGGFYSVDSIKHAINGSVGYIPFIDCDVDQAGNNQLHQVYLCVDKRASKFIECPVFPQERCGCSPIEFPSFSSSRAQA